jgi:hypothetical protein
LDTDIKMLKKYNGSSFVSAPTLKKMSSGLTSGLVSYYKMDETSGSTMVDSHGTNNGTISGATINQTGKVGKCYSFDGVNNYVATASNLGISGNQVRSFCGWLKSSKTNYSTEGYFFSAGGDGPNLHFGCAARGNPATWNVTEGNVWRNTGSSVSTDWTHVVVTYDQSNIRTYINGSLVDTFSYSSSNITNAPLYLSRYLGSSTAWFQGLIDEVGIWNRALTASEISELYNTNSGRKLETFDYDYADVKARVGSDWEWKNPIKYDQDLINGLVSYYSMEETSGSTMYDKVGTNNGTISGATINQTGKISKCYSFDGVNDYVLTSAPRPQDYTDYTMSLWVYVDSTIGSGDRAIVGYDGTHATNGLFALYYNGGTLTMYPKGTAGTFTHSVSTNTWYHVVLIREGSTTRAYIDGSSKGSGTGNTAKSGDGYNGVVYGSNRNYNNDFFKGRIDELGIWNRVLSATEVTKLYNYGKARYFE